MVFSLSSLLAFGLLKVLTLSKTTLVIFWRRLIPRFLAAFLVKVGFRILLSSVKVCDTAFAFISGNKRQPGDCSIQTKTSICKTTCPKPILSANARAPIIHQSPPTKKKRKKKKAARKRPGFCADACIKLQTSMLEISCVRRFGAAAGLCLSYSWGGKKRPSSFERFPGLVSGFQFRCLRRNTNNSKTLNKWSPIVNDL